MSELESLKRSNASLEREVATLRAERTASPARPAPTMTRAVDAGIDGRASQGNMTSRRT
ncbi:MAG: hypothetical protein M3506_10950 [Chloroflexota bacterium]|nr:hypothetical protein [Chloroflexota bacterium]